MMAQPWYAFDLIARVFGERLQGCEASAELRATMRSPAIDWERVVGLASAQFVLPAFAASLRDLALLGQLDEELGAFLEAVHAANLERNAELCDELAAVIWVLNRADIEPVLLKGAIRLTDGLYPDHGWRMLRDLDLLLPKPALAKAIRALEAAGYASCGSDAEVRRRGGVCQIDLHSELVGTSSRQARLVQAADVLERARRVTFGGGRVGIPAVEHQLIHLIGHSQIRHLGHAFGHVTWRSRLEAAALVHWGRESIDWQAVLGCFGAVGYHRPLLSFLLALSDGNLCAAPVTLKIDPLTALQERRIALQARSTSLGYIGSRVGWCVSELKRQIEERDGSQRRAAKNLRKLIFERAARRMVRAWLDRQRHLMHVLPYLSWLVAQ
jgi:hypothetical protein